MRRGPRPFALAAVSLLCILVLAACNSAPTLKYITISPTSATTSVGNTQQFTAQAYFSNGTITNGTALVAWGSTNQTVATISLGGLATPLAPGTTTITAAAAGTTGASATLTVNQLSSITVSPATATIAVGATQNYTASGTFANPGGTPTTMDVTSLATWTLGTPAVATLSNTGNTPVMATGATTGTTSVLASLYGVTGNATLTVSPPVPVSLQITPAAPTAAVGNALTFTALELLSNGNTQPLTGTVTWSSDTPATATILAGSGIAAAQGVGTANITASETSSSGPLTGTTLLTVTTGSAKFAYIANANDLDIQWYAVNTATSPYLTGGGNTGNAGYLPVQTVLHPSGNYLYSISSAAAIYTYDIAPASSTTPAPGTLTLTNPTPLPVGVSGDDLWGVVDPYGRFIYVSDDGLSGGPSTIYGYQISQTDGSLTPIAGTGASFNTNLNAPQSLVIDHSGTYLYAVNQGNGTVSIYTINQTTGALAALAGQASIATGSTPESGALHPSGAYLYVANEDNTVSAYSIDTSTDSTAGQLTALSGSPYTIAGAVDVFNVLVDPSGNFLYVLDAGSANGQVYSYNLSSGAVGTAVGSPVATGAVPFSFAIDPTGVLLAAANSSDVPGDISLFPVASGVLGTVTTVPSDTAASQNKTGSEPFFIVFYNTP